MSLTRLGKVLDEEYQTWEDRLQREFQAFIESVRNHFQKKEKNLQEYQIDLCQREKELQNSEEIYQQKMAMLKESEEEMKKRMDSVRDSVTLQLQNNIDSYRAGCQDAGVQTDPVNFQPARPQNLQQQSPNVHKDQPQTQRTQDTFDGSYGLYVKSPPNPNLAPNLSSPRQQQPQYHTNTEEQQYRQKAESYYASNSQSNQSVQRGQYPPTVQSPSQETWKAEYPDQSYSQSHSANSDSGYNQQHISQNSKYYQQPVSDKPDYHQQQPVSDKPDYHRSQQQQSYSSAKQPHGSFQQSPPFSYSSTSSQLESPDPNDRSSSRSSNLPAQSSRLVTSPGASANPSVPPRSHQVDGLSDYQQQYQRSRLGRPPPPLGTTRGYPQRYEKRSLSAEMLDAYPQRAQSPSPERENQRSFSADKVESPRMKRIEVPRSQSAERLLDGGYSYSQADTSQSHKQPPLPRREAPPYNGPPAYSKHSTPYSYTSPPSAPSHSRESSANGHGEGAIIESRTLEVQVARSKSVTDSNIPSPKEKAVKFGVAVFPPKAEATNHPKSPFPRTSATDETEPDMTSTPVEDKEVVFPDTQGENYRQQKQLPISQPQFKKSNDSYGYSASNAHGSRITSPPSRLAAPGHRQQYTGPARNTKPSSQKPEGAKPSPYSKYSTPPSNVRQPASGTPAIAHRPTSATQRQPVQRTGPHGVQMRKDVQQRTHQTYPQKNPNRTSKEINNNRPISDFTEDDVFVSDTPPSKSQSSYASSKLRQPAASTRASRNVTTHHKSRIAHPSRTLAPNGRSSNGVPRGIPQRPAYHPQQPEPQQPVRQQNYNQNNMAVSNSNMAADTSNMADDSMSSSTLSISQNRHFDFSPTYKALYNKYHSPNTVRRLNEISKRKKQEELERESNSPKSPTWRSRSRLPNYGKYISEIQEVPVPTKILDQ